MPNAFDCLIDSIAFVETHREAGSAEDFVIYERDGAASIAIGAKATLVVADEKITVFEGDKPLFTEVARDPFEAVPRALARIGGASWRAYGYFAFDACNPRY